jgi:hypothetical protein
MSVQLGEVLSRQYTDDCKAPRSAAGIVILGNGVKRPVVKVSIAEVVQSKGESWRMEPAGSALERDRGSANPGGTFPPNLVRGDVDPSLPAAPVMRSVPIPTSEKYLSGVVTVAPQGKGNPFDSSKERSTYEKLKSCFKSLLCCC